jgi:hypothetical protein
MLVVSSGLLLTAWIIGIVFEGPSRWIHVLLLRMGISRLS